MSLSLANVSLGANVLLAAITAYYAFLTQKLLAANRESLSLAERQMEAQSRPYIEVSPLVREGSSMFQLRISNSGKSSANNLRLTIAPDFYRLHNKSENNHLQRLYPFSENIDSFGPALELVIDLGVSYQFFQGPENDAVSPPRFTVHASYSSESNRYDETTVVDLNIFRGSSAAAVGSVQELKEMNKEIGRLTAALKGVADRLKEDG
jgi:hypothetical protein